MSHIYQCGKCRAMFEIGDLDREYNHDPQTRNCLSCGDALGNVMYLGYRGGTSQIISDYINSSAGDAVKSMIDGKMYDSKSAYYKSVKAAGCVVMGNDAPTENKYKPKMDIDWKPAIAEAMQRLNY